MKDIFERPINLKDIVACRRIGSRDLVIGQVIRFGAKQVVVEYKYRGHPKTISHYPQNVCKADGFMFDSLIDAYQKEVDEFGSQKFWTDNEYERAVGRRDTLERVIQDLKKHKNETP